MRPKIDRTNFGLIFVDGEPYQYDIIIRLNGSVQKRKKKLSKAYYGTSHKISEDEASFLYEEGADRLIIGSGQEGMVHLSDEAKAFFSQRGVAVELHPTPEAIRCWNEAKDSAIGLFHITC